MFGRPMHHRPMTDRPMTDRRRARAARAGRTRRATVLGATALGTAAGLLVATGTGVAGAAPRTVTPAAAPTALSAASSPVLAVYRQLHTNDRVVNGATTLVMQGDGNLVLYAGPHIAMWASHTHGVRGAFANLKPNNQLVVRDARGRIVWATPPAAGPSSGLFVSPGGEMSVQSGSTRVWSTGTAITGWAVAALSSYGWGAQQWPCLDRLWERESSWSPTAQNSSSGAYGIPQALPGSKMASAGGDWRTNFRTQIDWGLGYINDRYGSPCGAWAHSQRYGWYSVPTKPGGAPGN